MYFVRSRPEPFRGIKDCLWRHCTTHEGSTSAHWEQSRFVSNGINVQSGEIERLVSRDEQSVATQTLLFSVVRGAFGACLQLSQPLVPIDSSFVH